uniref:Uncharacterized protein n=1 Tax=Salvator merianae TaxID=96440 RepID=A0A8D0KIF5_SALMN
MKGAYYFWCSSMLWTWVAVSEHPCSIDKEGRASCSRKGLLHAPASLPRHINTLDLSFNSLTIPRHGLFLKGFLSLRSLNLSSNSIPTVHSMLFHNLHALHLLDLSNCSISYIHPKTFLGLKNLHTLLLTNNKLKALDPSVFPIPGALVHLDVRNNKLTYTEELAQLFVQGIDHVRLQGNPWTHNNSITYFQQGLKQQETKLIYDNSHLESHDEAIQTWDKQDISRGQKFRVRRDSESPTPASPGNETSTLGNTNKLEKTGRNWPYFIAFVLLAIAISVLIAVVAKCKLLQRNRASYHHQRLPDSRSVGSSHAEEAGVDVAYGRNPPIPGATGYHAEDDDGFIEDNYIEPNQDLREEGEEEKEEEEEEEEEDLAPHFKL